MKNDIGGVCKLSWLLFKLNYKSRSIVYEKFKTHFDSYGIAVTKNRKRQLVFHIDEKMKSWITLHK